MSNRPTRKVRYTKARENKENHDDLDPILEEDCVKMDFENEYDLFSHYFESFEKFKFLENIYKEVEADRRCCRLFEGTILPAIPDLEYKPVPLKELLPVIKNKNKKLDCAASKIELEKNAQYGRHLRATKSISSGEILIVEKSPLSIIRPNCEHVRATIYNCHYCGKKLLEGYLPCHNCDICLYCDYDCRKRAWFEFHQWECYGLQRHLFSVSEPSYVAMRILMYGAWTPFFKKEIGLCDDVDMSVKPPTGENYEQMYGLSYSLKSKPKEELKLIMKACSKIVLYLMRKTNFFTWLKKQCQNDVTPKKLLLLIGSILIRHFCQFELNGGYFHLLSYHTTYFLDRESEVAFVPLVTAMINHSCDPNVICTYQANHMIVKAIKPIKKGEQLFCCYTIYTDPIDPVEKKKMMQSQGFQCYCKKCTSEDLENSSNCFLCQKCWRLTGLNVPAIQDPNDPTKYICVKKHVNDEGVYKNLVIITKLEMSKYYKHNNSTHLTNALHFARVTYNENHSTFLDILIPLITNKLECGIFDEAFEHIERAVKIIDEKFPIHNIFLLEKKMDIIKVIINACKTKNMKIPANLLENFNTLVLNTMRIIHLFYIHSENDQILDSFFEEIRHVVAKSENELEKYLKDLRKKSRL